MISLHDVLHVLAHLHANPGKGSARLWVVWCCHRKWLCDVLGRPSPHPLSHTFAASMSRISPISPFPLFTWCSRALEMCSPAKMQITCCNTASSVAVLDSIADIYNVYACRNALSWKAMARNVGTISNKQQTCWLAATRTLAAVPAHPPMVQWCCLEHRWVGPMHHLMVPLCSNSRHPAPDSQHHLLQVLVAVRVPLVAAGPHNIDSPVVSCRIG